MTIHNQAPRQEGITVIFKGSNRCNAGCTFCSVGIPDGRVISWEEFTRVADELERLVIERRLTKLEFTFHGGEPTLLGARFIDRACERIAELPVKVGFSMQSNLLFWDEEIIEVLTRHQVRVGSSIDPISSGRLDGEGNDAFPLWLENYLQFSKRGFTIGAIFVVTRSALGQARRLYEMAESISNALEGDRPFGLQINPVYPQGKASDDPSVLISPREFGEFMVELWRIWETSDRSVQLTPIGNFVEHILEPEQASRSLSCSFTGNCSRSHVGIDFNLNVAGCGRRLDSGAVLGNLKETGLVEILNGSEEKKKIAGRAEGLRLTECGECRFYPICHGGCPDDATLLGGSIEDRFGWCEAYKMLFEAIESRSGSRFDRDRVKVFSSVAPQAILPHLANPGSKEAWVMPAADGSNLGFESGLVELGGARNTRVKLWVHNRNVRYLAMWERMLGRRNVSVVLFEQEGLLEAASFLGGLGAHIILDTVSLCAGGGAFDEMGEILDRFVFDSNWGSRVSPFDQILMNVVRDMPPSFMNWLGLRPGSVQLELEGPHDGMAGDLAAWVKEEDRPLSRWLGDREPCIDCSFVKSCGCCMVSGDGNACSPGALELVKKIESIGLEMRQQMGPR